MSKKICILLATMGLCGANCAEPSVGVVNFSTCIQESKYGKHEQKNLENIRKQWSTLIQETEKELKDIHAKLNDKDYVDGLSPEAEDALKGKFKSLSEDMAKYQEQLYQIMNQAQYYFVQKVAENISKASEELAKKGAYKLVVNKEACFYYATDMDITKQVLTQMDKNFDVDAKNNKISENSNLPLPPKGKTVAQTTTTPPEGKKE